LLEGIGDRCIAQGFYETKLLPDLMCIVDVKGYLQFGVPAILQYHGTLVPVYTECHLYIGQGLQAVDNMDKKIPGDIDLYITFPVTRHTLRSVEYKEDPGVDESAYHHLFGLACYLHGRQYGEQENDSEGLNSPGQCFCIWEFI
jgi:hypothetical protein